MEKGHGKGNNIKNQRSEAKGKGNNIKNQRSETKGKGKKCYKGTKYDHNS